MPPISSTNTPFSKGRRKIALNQIHLLKNSSGDRRIKLDLSIILDGDGAAGMPSFVQDMFEAVAKDSSSITSAKSGMEIEGSTADFFSTDKNKTAAIRLSSSTLKSFAMSTKRVKGQDLSSVVLSFALYTSASKQLWDYGYDLQGGEAFAEFQAGQLSFLDAKDDPEGEDE